MKRGGIAVIPDPQPTSPPLPAKVSRRRFNESTARVEEIPEDEVQVKPKSRFPPATASTPLTVNVQQPSVDQRTQEGQDQPAGRPQTFGPSVRAVEWSQDSSSWMRRSVLWTDRMTDGLSSCFCWFPDGDHAAIFQTPSIGREKKCEWSFTPLNALPLFTHPKGGPGVVVSFLGFHLFRGWFMRVHVLFSGMPVESCWIIKG